MKDKPLTIEEYNMEIDLAEDDIKNGNIYTHEDVKEMIEGWER